jgi:hypothetical protein
MAEGDTSTSRQGAWGTGYETPAPGYNSGLAYLLMAGSDLEYQFQLRDQPSARTSARSGLPPGTEPSA